MRPARIVLAGVIAVALSACVGPAAVDPAIDSSRMPSLSADQVCPLISVAEATSLLRRPLAQAPSDLGTIGQASTCFYLGADRAQAGTYIEIEFTRLGFSGQATLINFHRDAHTLLVGGYPAIGADFPAGGLSGEAVLSVRIARSTADPALWIEAPTSAIAIRVAELVLPRLVALR